MKILLNALIEQVIYHHRQADQPGKNANATKKDLPQFRTSMFEMPLFQAAQEN